MTVSVLGASALAGFPGSMGLLPLGRTHKRRNGERRDQDQEPGVKLFILSSRIRAQISRRQPAGWLKGETDPGEFFQEAESPRPYSYRSASIGSSSAARAAG